jgi:hypothetical protein
MGTFIRMLVMVLFLVLAPAPGAFARGGPGGVHGGFHGGDFGRGGGWRHGGFHEGFHRGFGHFHHPHFHGGIFFEVPPLWVVPAPYIGVTPAPPSVWYYCSNPPGYYPTVPSCTMPWTSVYPQP